jgi:hypothetical protein
MRKAAELFSAVVLCGLAAPAGAEPVPKGCEPFLERIEASIAPVRARRGQTVILRVRLDLKDRARAYPTQDPNSEFAGLEPVRVKVLDSTTVVPVGPLREPLFRTEDVPSIGSYRLVEGHAVWEQRLVVSHEATVGEHKIAVKVSAQITNDRM